MVISHLIGYFSCHTRQTHSLLCWIGLNRLKHQWDRSRSTLKWHDGYECALEVIGCSLHLHNAVKAGSCVSVVCSYSLHARVKRMGFSIWSMVVDDVHFLCFFLFSSWFAFAWFDLMILNEWEWMEVVCWRMKMKMNEISFENEQTSWTSIFFFFQRGREMRFSLIHWATRIFRIFLLYVNQFNFLPIIR